MMKVMLTTCDDEISYEVTAQRALRRKSVRVTVPVELIVGPDEIDQGSIETKVREALSRFLAVDWVTSDMTRYGDAAGYERLSMTASARIPVEHAYALGERARSAGTKGLSIGEPALDYRVPRAVVARISGDLRREVVEQVQAQIDEFNTWTGRSWRIGSIVFGASGATGQRTAKGVYRDEELDDGEPQGAAQLTGVERLQLVASVTLRAVAAGSRSSVPATV